MPATSSLSPAAIALNRFGLGARPSEEAPVDPQAFLLAQLDRFGVRPSGFAALADPGSLMAQLRAERQAAKESGGSPDRTAAMKAARQDFGQQARALYRAAVEARVASALATEAPFVERMVHFWSNHFCISAENPRVAAYAGAFERDAIRPHVLGRFGDMLLAVEQHPAMLMFLNQAGSVGPDSAAARAHPRLGLNENLGREIMELHTLGVRSGYTQADVTEMSRALTGWTVAGLGPNADGDPDAFAFRPARHEPGPRTVLGRNYGEGGEAQAAAVLADLAKSPATATHIATKLARHFAGDDPPPALVERLAGSFTTTSGDLPSLYRTLISSPEPWVATPQKFKTPWEWTISALRGLGRRDAGPLHAADLERQLGQPWTPGSPAGWEDVAGHWMSPDALLRRVEVASRLAGQLGGGLDARSLAPRLLPASLNPAAAAEIARAESASSALALLLVSPDFLRR